MNRPRRSIRGKLVALTLVVILLPISCVLGLVGTEEIRDIRADMLASSALISSVIAEYGAAALAFDSRPAAEEALQVLAHNRRFLDAEVYDSSGRLFAAFHSAEVARPAPPPQLSSDQRQQSTLGKDEITTVYPVVQAGQRFGTLVVHTALAPLTSRVHEYLWGLMWLILGVVAASLALAWALERMVSRRLRRLAAVAREIASQGDLAVRASDQGNDEIGVLAAAFNYMVAELGRRQEQALEAIRVRDEFLSVASHELKTPLTSLKLRVQGFLEHAPAVIEPAQAQRLQRSFDLAERQVRRLENLVNSLLDVSRIAVGHFPLQLGEVDLVPLVRSVVGQFSTEIARGPVEVLLDLPESARGRWDLLRVEQILVNLLSNALKYGAGKPIEVMVRTDDITAWLTVRDHGLGIEAEDQARIFERFERAVSLNYGGLGLGLYITRQIVLAHGGTIHVESVPGEGSSFVVELPLAGPAETELGETCAAT